MNILRIVLFLTSLSAAQAQITEFLHVQGREVVNEQNQVVKLRGINMDAYYWTFQWDTLAPINYADETDIQYLDSLGANVIRLCLHWRYFNTNYGYNFVDNYLQWCDSAGLYVILDMHAIPPDLQFGDDGTWDDPVAQAQLCNLWKDIAARYVNRAVVAGYDLANEPNPADSSQWWTLAQRVTDSIRTVDTTHIIFVEETMNHAMFQLIDDPNVVYSYHDYSPFSVSHAGAEWINDGAMPDDYFYPGSVADHIEWMDYARDQDQFYDQAAAWMFWESGPIIVPANTNYATIKPGAWSDVGDVWYDDLSWSKNGVTQPVVNASMEEGSWIRPGQASTWYFHTGGGMTGEWDAVAHSGLRSLRISGAPNQWATWSQSQWLLLDPLMQVVPGDTIRASGWILAPTNNGGSIDIGCDYFLVTYANCDRARLASDIQPYIDWSVAHNVPLWCGEFGCMSAAPGNSRFNLVRDKISVMNNAGIGWAMWSYRSEQPPSFGLTFQDSVVQALADILAFGFEGETWRVADLTLVRDGQDMLLQWSPVPGASSYSIYAGETPEESEILSTIVGTSATGSFRHLSATSLPKRYYLVIAHFN